MILIINSTHTVYNATIRIYFALVIELKNLLEFREICSQLFQWN
jgi:hypothetical protein